MNDYTRYLAAVKHPNKPLDRIIRHEEMQRLKNRIRNASPDKAVSLDLQRIHVKKIAAYRRYLAHEKQVFARHHAGGGSSMQRSSSAPGGGRGAVVRQVGAGRKQLRGVEVGGEEDEVQSGPAKGTAPVLSRGSRSSAAVGAGAGNKGKGEQHQIKITGEKNRLALILGNIVQNLENMQRSPSYQEDPQVRKRIEAIREKFSAIKTHMRYSQALGGSADRSGVADDIQVRTAVAGAIRRAEKIVAKEIAAGDAPGEGREHGETQTAAVTQSDGRQVRQAQAEHAESPPAALSGELQQPSGGSAATVAGGDNQAAPVQSSVAVAAEPQAPVEEAPTTFPQHQHATSAAPVAAGGAGQKITPKPAPKRKGGVSSAAKETGVVLSKDSKNREKASVKEVCVLRHQATVIQQQAAVIQQQAQLIAQAVKNDQLAETGGMMAEAMKSTTNVMSRSAPLQPGAATLGGKDFGKTKITSEGGAGVAGAGGGKNNKNTGAAGAKSGAAKGTTNKQGDGGVKTLNKRSKYGSKGSKSKLPRVPEEGSLHSKAGTSTSEIQGPGEDEDGEPFEPDEQPLPQSEVVQDGEDGTSSHVMTSLESSPQEPRQGTHMGGRAGPMAHDVVQGLVENAVGTHGEHGTSTGTPDDAGPRQVVDTGETLDSDRKVPTTPRLAAAGARIGTDGDHSAAGSVSDTVLEDALPQNSGRREGLLDATGSPAKRRKQHDDDDDDVVAEREQKVEEEQDHVIEQFLVGQGIEGGFDYKASKIQDKFLKKSELEFDSPGRRRNDVATKLLLTDFREDLDQILHRLTRARAAQAVAEFVDKAHSELDAMHSPGGPLGDAAGVDWKTANLDPDQLLIHQVLRMTESLGEVERGFLQNINLVEARKEAGAAQVDGVQVIGGPPPSPPAPAPSNPFVQCVRWSTTTSGGGGGGDGGLERSFASVEDFAGAVLEYMLSAKPATDEEADHVVLTRIEATETSDVDPGGAEQPQHAARAEEVVFDGSLRKWFQYRLQQSAAERLRVEPETSPEAQIQHIIHKYLYLNRFSEQGDANGPNSRGGTAGSYRMRIPLLLDTTKRVSIPFADHSSNTPGDATPVASSRSGSSAGSAGGAQTLSKSPSRGGKNKRKRSRSCSGRRVSADENEEVYEQLVEISTDIDDPDDVRKWKEQHCFDRLLLCRRGKAAHGVGAGAATTVDPGGGSADQDCDATWVQVKGMNARSNTNILANFLLLPESPPDSVRVFATSESSLELFRLTAAPRGSSEKTVAMQIDNKLRKWSGLPALAGAASTSEWEPPEGIFLE